MSDQRQNGMWNAFGPMGPMMAQAAGPWMQVARMWSDSMAQFVPGGSQAMDQWMAMWPTMAGVASRAGAPVRVQVASSRPVAVQVVLAPGAEYMTLGASPVAQGGEALGGVTLSTAEGRVTVAVVVSDTQAVGTYRGPVVDGGGNPRGELVVEISAS